MSVFHLAPSVAGRSTPWAERADLLAREGTVLRVHADGALAWTTLEHAYAQKALKTARELGDPHSFYVAAFFAFSVMTSGTEQVCFDLATEIALSPRPDIRPRTLFRTLERVSEVLLAWGERDLAERIAEELEARADATGEPAAARIAGHVRISLAAIDGRLEEAVSEAGRLASAETGMLAWTSGFRPLLLLGSPEYLHRAEEVLDKLEGPLRNILYALWSVNAGIPFIPEPGQNPTGPQPTFWRMVALEVVVKMLPIGPPSEEGKARRKEYVRRLLGLLEPASSPATQEIFTLIDRQRGAAYVLLEERENARQHFLAALAAGEKMRFRPEVALTRLALAELILDHFPRQRAEAFEHLDFCIPEFREMKMLPSLRKAEELLTRRGRQRPRRPDYPDRLSAREVEILRLIAQGRTNQQIAAGLTISLNTVLHHVTNILGKTGAANRAEATDYAHRHSLIE
jgi:DNA-binding CsgD family transcriptional regulator